MFQIQMSSIPAEVRPGEPLRIVVTIKNIGNLAVLNTQPIRIESCFADSLLPCNEATIRGSAINGSKAVTLQLGSYSKLMGRSTTIYIDKGNLIKESNETNNHIVVPINAIMPTPVRPSELHVTTPVGGDRIYYGQTLNIGWTATPDIRYLDIFLQPLSKAHACVDDTSVPCYSALIPPIKIAQNFDASRKLFSLPITQDGFISKQSTSDDPGYATYNPGYATYMYGGYYGYGYGGNNMLFIADGKYRVSMVVIGDVRGISGGSGVFDIVDVRTVFPTPVPQNDTDSPTQQNDTSLPWYQGQSNNLNSGQKLDVE
ncbi:MAG: hypothetical protein UY09_C0047G0009 [Parcubacteria group bacterium GW2011_GWA2_47_8]|nr:MAG: hypothetical protein UY09_C0047G0009 [Parcubacteria group bacterium GW2011_GWA2_47_8]